MKKNILVCIIHLLSLQVFSQYPLYTLLPSGVSGIVFGDTLLNTRTVLQREGIKKITAIQTSSRSHSSFTTMYKVTDGRIEARYWCYRPAPDTAFRFCQHDTLLYDIQKRLQEYRAGNSNDPFLKMMYEYKTDSNVSITSIMKDPRKLVADTSIYHQGYNGKGQLTSQHYEPGAPYPLNANLYYNKDGLPDSIRHEDPTWEAYTFSHKRKGKKLLLILETTNGTHKWTYNATGQCIASEWTSKFLSRSPNSDVRKLFTEIKYEYNADGTLSKVVEKRTNEKIITAYTYER